jgi:hypothetical protein
MRSGEHNLATQRFHTGLVSTDYPQYPATPYHGQGWRVQFWPLPVTYPGQMLGIPKATRILSQARHKPGGRAGDHLEMCTRSTGDLIETVTSHYDRRPCRRRFPWLMAERRTTRAPERRRPSTNFRFEPWLQESSWRCYNPSVNSRTAYRQFTLQTKGLDVRKANIPGIWCGIGVTHYFLVREVAGASTGQHSPPAPWATVALHLPSDTVSPSCLLTPLFSIRPTRRPARGVRGGGG